jgi:hypothetical protein
VALYHVQQVRVVLAVLGSPGGKMIQNMTLLYGILPRCNQPAL